MGGLEVQQRGPARGAAPAEKLIVPISVPQADYGGGRGMPGGGSINLTRAFAAIVYCNGVAAEGWSGGQPLKEEISESARIRALRVHPVGMPSQNGRFDAPAKGQGGGNVEGPRRRGGRCQAKVEALVGRFLLALIEPLCSAVHQGRAKFGQDSPQAWEGPRKTSRKGDVPEGGNSGRVKGV